MAPLRPCCGAFLCPFRPDLLTGPSPPKEGPGCRYPPCSGCSTLIRALAFAGFILATRSQEDPLDEHLAGRFEDWQDWQTKRMELSLPGGRLNARDLDSRRDGLLSPWRSDVHEEGSTPVLAASLTDSHCSFDG